MSDAQHIDQPSGQGAPESGMVSGGEAAWGSAEAPTPPVAVESDSEEESHDLLPHPVVAIGGSKGGLEAYIELFRSVPADTGMSFVVLPHLAPDSESRLAQILAGVTRMPVQEIASGARLEPNRVYVLAPNVRATVNRGIFRTEPRLAGERIPMPIDPFFRSLAADQKNRAIGVVMSGGDSDGALGLRTIKGEGGIAIVQDPDSARAPDMRLAGILADHVDLILPPAEIAAELSRLARQFFQPSLQMLEEGQLAPADKAHFTRLLHLLRTVAGIDFRNYRPTTLRRRTARRMILRRIESLAEYVRFLHESRDELRNLHEDVLINVTRFFRDPSVFEALKTDILPALLDGRPPEQQVRIWVAGCSSGEEAYSIAMCVLEYAASQPHEPPIQIFGTDASERSIEKARIAIYPESIAKDVSPERLRRFFVKTDKGYQISKRVRDLCIFARQNLCNDPPFSRLDVISCRNVLMYLDRPTQSHVITTFHYALRGGGSLLLGHSESVTDTAGLFTPVDRKNKFYAKIGDESEYALVTIRRPPMPETTPRAPVTPATSRATHAGADLRKAADRVVLARHGPPGAVINEEMDVVEVRGRPAPFLAIGPGTPSLQLLRMAHPDILPSLRDAVRRAVETGGPVVEDIAVHHETRMVKAALEVLPLEPGLDGPRHYLVLFVPNRGRDAAPEEPGVRDAARTGAERDQPERELARAHRNLTTTRLYLQSLIEGRDARNQELTAAYEEIQSSNEELQSTNEELETAKEELQSTNEDLQTVNDELRNRNQALLQSSNDFSNFLNSVDIPVVMLGSDLTIRQYTPPAERLMRLRAADIGRPIGEIRLNLDIEEIEPLLHEVIDNLAVKEMEVQDRSGRWHLLRLRPYRTSENRIEGVVLVLLDIDQMRRTQAALQQTRDFAQTVVESVPVPLAVLDHDLRVRTANASFRSLSGLSPTDLEKRPFAEMMTMLWDWPDMREPLHRLMKEPGGAPLYLEHETDRTPVRALRMVGRSVAMDGERAVLIVVEDLTAERQAVRALESDRARLAGQVQSTAEVLGRTREELRALAGRLFTSQEDERRRVARELHDDISQKLALLDFDTQRLLGDLPSDREEIATWLASLRDRTGALATDVRALSHRLHPSALDHLGLADALKMLVDEFGERERMLCTFRRHALPARIPSEVAMALYRIAQEALRNIAKHAGRTHVKVRLEGVEDGLRMTIQDFGEGFEMDDDAWRGLGLVSMEERARLAGGELSVQSELGQGTTVTVVVPLGAKAAD